MLGSREYGSRRWGYWIYGYVDDRVWGGGVSL